MQFLIFLHRVVYSNLDTSGGNGVVGRGIYSEMLFGVWELADTNREGGTLGFGMGWVAMKNK